MKKGYVRCIKGKNKSHPEYVVCVACANAFFDRLCFWIDHSHLLPVARKKRVKK